MDKIFTDAEKIDLILYYYQTTCGVLDTDIQTDDLLKRFYNAGFTIKDRDEFYNGFYVLSHKGDVFLHEMIKDVTNNFVNYLRRHGNKSDELVALNWFKENYKLDDTTSREIFEYILDNSHNYGVTIKKGLGQRGRFVQCQ